MSKKCRPPSSNCNDFTHEAAGRFCVCYVFCVCNVRGYELAPLLRCLRTSGSGRSRAQAHAKDVRFVLVRLASVFVMTGPRPAW